MVIPVVAPMTIYLGADYLIGWTLQTPGDPPVNVDLTGKVLTGAIRLAGKPPAETPDALITLTIDDAAAGHFFESCDRNASKDLSPGKLYNYTWLMQDTGSGAVDELKRGAVILFDQSTMPPP